MTNVIVHAPSQVASGAIETQKIFYGAICTLIITVIGSWLNHWFSARRKARELSQVAAISIREQYLCVCDLYRNFVTPTDLKKSIDKFYDVMSIKSLEIFQKPDLELIYQIVDFMAEYAECRENLERHEKSFRQRSGATLKDLTKLDELTSKFAPIEENIRNLRQQVEVDFDKLTKL